MHNGNINIGVLESHGKKMCLNSAGKSVHYTSINYRDTLVGVMLVDL